MAAVAVDVHLDALELKVEMVLDHHSHSWFLQVWQKNYVHFAAMAVPDARSPRLRKDV